MSFDLDDELRGLTEEEDEFGFLDEAENNVIPDSSATSTSKFLGMTAVERMFLSIFLFMNVAVIGVALLLATGRIG